MQILTLATPSGGQDICILGAETGEPEVGLEGGTAADRGHLCHLLGHHHCICICSREGCRGLALLIEVSVNAKARR